MALQRLPNESLHGDDTPQAIVFWDEAAASEKWALEKDWDGLDEYVGAAFRLDDGTEFKIKRHKGNPDDHFTIYLPMDVTDVDVIEQKVDKAMEALDIPSRDIYWSRPMHGDPDFTQPNNFAAGTSPGPSGGRR